MANKNTRGQAKRIEERGRILMNFEVEPKMAEAIRSRARAEERTVSGLIRLAIKRYLGKEN